MSYIPPEKLKELAKDRKNKVYAYVDQPPLPKDKIVPLDEVSTIINELFDEKKRLLALYPTIPQNELIKVIKRTSRWREFDKTHTHIFAECCRLEAGDREKEMMLKLVVWKKTNPTMDQEIRKEQIWKKFSMSEDEWKAKYGTEPKIIPQS
jgi:hypothetical protein